jgi:prophage antirepressor-like protein
MQSLIPMHFEDAEIRVVELNGEPWFVGKDVAEALGYANPADSFSKHCKGVAKRYPLSTPGGVQEVRLLPESDVMRLIVGSKLPAAEKFERWVFEEVLPTIRRTGSFVVRGKPQLRLIAPEFRAACSIARTAGLKGNFATLSAAQAVHKLHGVDPLEVIGATHLLAEEQVRYFTPTELGQRLGESARAFNQRLAARGLQEKRNGQWVPTETGRTFAVLLDTGKRHHDGTPVQQLKWLETVMSAVRDKIAA